MSAYQISNPLAIQYLYNNALYRDLDRNKHGVHSKREVSGFARSMELAAGAVPDADTPADEFDAGIDALLWGRGSEGAAAEGIAGQGGAYDLPEYGAGGPDDEEWLIPLSGRPGSAPAIRSFLQETAGSLHGAMSGGGSLYAGLNAINSYNTAKTYRSGMNPYAVSSSFSIML